MYDITKIVGDKQKKERVNTVTTKMSVPSDIMQSRLKQRISIAEKKHAKRCISDEQILAIRSAYDSGKTTKDICEMFNLSRQYISDICHRNVLTREEMCNKELQQKRLEQDTQKENQDKEIKKRTSMTNKDIGIYKTALSKRTCRPETILQIMMEKYKNRSIKPKHVFELYKMSEPTLTIDKVKQYISGKTKLFECEFPIHEISYDTYQDIVKVLCEVRKP